MSDTVIGGNAAIGSSAGLDAVAAVTLGTKARCHYKVENWRGVKKRFVGGYWEVLRRLGLPAPAPEYDYSSARLVWVDGFENLVVTVGKNYALDAYLGAGTVITTWYVGLKDTGTVVAGDTMGSHAGWAELTVYSNANRPTYTPAAAASGSVDNSASKAVFNINATDDVYGSFLTSNNTKGGTTGTLYGAGDFTVSPRSVVNGDTLNVTVTASI